jgi:hypothetical protein
VRGRQRSWMRRFRTTMRCISRTLCERSRSSCSWLVASIVVVGLDKTMMVFSSSFSCYMEPPQVVTCSHAFWRLRIRQCVARLDRCELLIFAFEASLSVPKRDVRLTAVQRARVALALCECQGGFLGRAGSYLDLNNFLEFLLKLRPPQASAAQLLVWKH